MLSRQQSADGLLPASAIQPMSSRGCSPALPCPHAGCQRTPPAVSSSLPRSKNGGAYAPWAKTALALHRGVARWARDSYWPRSAPPSLVQADSDDRGFWAGWPRPQSGIADSAGQLSAPAPTGFGSGRLAISREPWRRRPASPGGSATADSAARHGTRHRKSCSGLPWHRHRAEPVRSDRTARSGPSDRLFRG